MPVSSGNKILGNFSPIFDKNLFGGNNCEKQLCTRYISQVGRFNETLTKVMVYGDYRHRKCLLFDFHFIINKRCNCSKHLNNSLSENSKYEILLSIAIIKVTAGLKNVLDIFEPNNIAVSYNIFIASGSSSYNGLLSKISWFL